MTATASSVLRGLALVAVGVAIGYGAAMLRLDGTGDPETIVVPPLSTAAPLERGPRLEDRIVAVSDGTRALSTALVGSPAVVVVPAGFAAGAPRLNVRTASGERLETGAVLAADVESDLAAVAVNAGATDGLAVDREQGALYVGREFVALSVAGPASGWIDSAARRTRLGGYVYDARLDDAASAGVLLDADGGRVIGLAFPAADAAGEVAAVDVATLADLLATQRAWRPTGLAEFRRWYFRESPAGRVAELETLADAGRWQDMIDSAGLRLGLADGYEDEILTLLELAYVQAARQLSEADRPAAALDLLDEADRLLGTSPRRAVLSATLHERAGDADAALTAYLAAAGDGTDARDARDRARRVIAGAAASGTVADATLLSMIERAAEGDRRHAPYPLLAGEILLRLGRTGEAMAELNRALRLDPALAPRVGPLLETARARMSNPSTVRVPVVTQGDVMVVNVRINDSPRSYRFVLDTGASYTAVSLQAALELGINAMFTGTPQVELETANGRVFADVVNLASVSLGEARAGNVDAVILETMRGVDGLLGQSFLGRFDVRIRPGDGEVLLSPR